MALVAVIPLPNGTEQLQGVIWKELSSTGLPVLCAETAAGHYTPFSELQLLRAKRRKALGKADP
jgi:hypothetical protein